MSAADALRISAIRKSGHACPDKLKRLLSHPDPEFRTWTSGWKVGGSRVRNGGVHPGVNGGSQVQIQTRICCPDALRWCIRTHCLGIVLAFWIFLWQRTSKLRLFMFLSYPLLCHGFQITLLNLRFALVIKKLSKHQNLTHFLLELITRVLNMLIGLKGDNYYSKVFKRVNYKLWNSTFWVVINNI